MTKQACWRLKEFTTVEFSMDSSKFWQKKSNETTKEAYCQLAILTKMQIGQNGQESENDTNFEKNRRILGALLIKGLGKWPVAGADYNWVQKLNVRFCFNQIFFVSSISFNGRSANCIKLSCLLITRIHQRSDKNFKWDNKKGVIKSWRFPRK